MVVHLVPLEIDGSKGNRAGIIRPVGIGLGDDNVSHDRSFGDGLLGRVDPEISKIRCRALLGRLMHLAEIDEMAGGLTLTANGDIGDIYVVLYAVRGPQHRSHLDNLGRQV